MLTDGREKSTSRGYHRQNMYPAPVCALSAFFFSPLPSYLWRCGAPCMNKMHGTDLYLCKNAGTSTTPYRTWEKQYQPSCTVGVGKEKTWHEWSMIVSGSNGESKGERVSARQGGGRLQRRHQSGKEEACGVERWPQVWRCAKQGCRDLRLGEELRQLPLVRCFEFL